MSLVEVAIAHQNPIAVFETAPVAVDIVDQNTILVENTPVVGVVQYIAIKGDPGEAGHTPDWANPGDVADLIEALSGQITATQLHSDLLAPIQKIDVGPTSLEARAAMLEYADSLLNTSIAENADRITASEAAITTIDGQLLEFGVDLQTLDGRVTGNSAAIDSISTRVTANEADLYTQAQTIQGISSRVDIVETDQTAQAAIINQNTTAITVLDGDITSTAETLATITAGVAGMDAAIQIKNQVIAGTTTPLFAQHTVKIDVNGKISGFGLTSTDDSSVFEILADRFAVTNGLNNGIIPFIVDGSNVYIQNGFIQNAAIDTARIADASITTAKIQNAQITNALIADATIDVAKIKDATITAAKIADATITTAKIADAQITSAKIANATITTADIADAQITNALIADAAITSAKIQNATITGANIASATIGTANIAAASITTALIADANITNAKIGDASVTTLKIGGNAVTLPVGSSAYAPAYGNGITLLAVAFTAVGQPVLLNACCVVQCASGTSGTYRLLLYVDSTAVFDTGICSAIVAAASGSIVTNISHVVSVSAAYHTFSLVGYSDPDGSGDCNFLARTLVATELRR